jgi:hypothetical protein
MFAKKISIIVMLTAAVAGLFFAAHHPGPTALGA